MRKRVSTKSPVRENRTPGSVRGLFGNCQSYRDLRGEESSKTSSLQMSFHAASKARWYRKHVIFVLPEG
jgi:hypothetical protein